MVESTIQRPPHSSVGEVKTAASRRRIAHDDATVEMLKVQRKRQAEARLLVGPTWMDRDLVFTGPTGEPFYPETVTRTFRTRVDRLGLPPITLHGLRHTWASLALAAGIHAKVVQERLGHANVGITLNIYSHVAPVMHDDAAEQVAAMVRSAKAVGSRSVEHIIPPVHGGTWCPRGDLNPHSP